MDNEFDFIITSHVLEHVEDPIFFLNEIQRVSSKGGYIEVPTKLEDNFVFENKHDHLWHLDFDDDENKLMISKKINYFEPVLTVSSIKMLHKYFRKSLVLELYWENEINFSFDEKTTNNFEKISRLTLLRKFISKKIRIFF
jgi:ubiquinone/menaquinone biosynthesis C-methylase UbiE